MKICSARWGRERDPDLHSFIPTGILALFISELLLSSGCYLASGYMLGDGAMFLVYDSWLLRLALVVCMILLGLVLHQLL